MILYHVVSTYQLICVMIHRNVYHKENKAVLIMADFLAKTYSDWRKLIPDFFNEVYLFPYLEIEHTQAGITDKVIEKYNSILKYNIYEFDKIYILGAHFYFTAVPIFYGREFSCFEEAAGMLNNPDKLRSIVRKKYEIQANWADKNQLFDLSNPLIQEIYCLKSHESKNGIRIISFDAVNLLEKCEAEFREKCIAFFIKKKFLGGKEKSILLTEHFSNLGIMSKGQQMFFYKRLVLDFCDEDKLIIKPHPSDEQDYRSIFPKAEIIQERFPSELLPFIFEENPTVLLTMGSTAAFLLESYYTVQYIGGNSWSEIYLDHNKVYKYMIKEKMMENHSNCIKPAYSERNVPIAISCSNEYVKYLSVLIQSVIDSSSLNNNYDILILNRGIDERNQCLIKEQCKNDNFSVRFISTIDYIEGGSFYTEGLSIEAYFRMFLIDIMFNYEKTVYLDVDTYTLVDIAELLNINLENNYIAAAVDVNIVASYVAGNHWKPYIDEILKLDNPYEYVQSGVMVLNLEKMREDFSLEYLIEVSTGEKWRLYDQDVLNYLCKNNILFLDPVYNVINTQEGRLQNIQNFAPEYLREPFCEAYRNPKIIHFVGKKKPWISFNTDFSEYFWNAARKTPFYESLLINRITKIDLIDIKTQLLQLKRSAASIPGGSLENKSQAVPKPAPQFHFAGKIDASAVQKKILFRCQSIYQLLNAIVIKLSMPKESKADVILTKTTNFGSVLENLLESGIFRRVLFSEDTPNTYIEWRGYDNNRQKDIWERPERYILPVDELEEGYTDYYIAVADEYNKIFYYYLLQKGMAVRIHMFEDGMNSYILNNAEQCKNDFINHGYYGDLSFDKRMVEHLVYQPSFVIERNCNIEYSQISKIDSLAKNYRNILQKVFLERALPQQKYIFLEEAFFQDGIAATDVELLETVSEVVGKENIIVKLHPRNQVDRFSARGFAVMENTVTPWEIVLLNSDISKKVFLTISSTAALSAGLSFQKEFKAIYMYNVMTLGANIHVRQNGFSALMKMIKKNINQKKMQIMTPNSMDELIEDFIYIERGV